MSPQGDMGYNRVQGRRLNVPQPFYKKEIISVDVGVGEIAELELPDGIIELKGLKIATDTNQTITNVWHNTQEDENLLSGALAGAADLEWTLVGSITIDVEDVFGKPAVVKNKIIAEVTQATGAQNLTIEVWGRRSVVMG